MRYPSNKPRTLVDDLVEVVALVIFVYLIFTLITGCLPAT